MSPNTAALILAGGQSRRMGQDKALLTLPTSGQQTLLEHVCAVAQACVSKTYVLTPWPERYFELLPADVVFLQEANANTGPLTALSQGWSMILADGCEPSPDWLLVLACDMPALDGCTIQTWQRTLATVNNTAIAMLPRQDNRWEPLCGFYHRRCIPGLETAIDNNVQSFQHWLAHERVISLTVPDSNMLRNCNTPVQWRQFLDSLNARNL